MNQFKPILQGLKEVENGQRRVVNSQKCIRAGGKHNDLDDVGKDNYHHTFFEMLGNWSFGDYYKKEACEFAWSYLVDVLKIDESRLYVTYFGGDDKLGLPPDEECAKVWKSLGLPSDRIIPSSAKDNFWEMAEFGPCGPCSEIHIDKKLDRKYSVADLVNQDNPEVVELWNIVFMEYDRKQSGMEFLPQRNIDCGMGFERLVSVLQNVDSNYDTDIFQPILRRIGDFSRVGEYSGKLGNDDSKGKDTAYRIIADHLRTCSIAIGDGVKPSGTNRGFVVRKMLRRAALASTDILGIDRKNLAEVSSVVIENLGSAYPELIKNKQHILKTIDNEEDKLYRVVDNGKLIFERFLKTLPSAATVFPGNLAFELHDAHGFTIDLTQRLAASHGLTVDLQAFQQHVTAARELSQQQSKMPSKIRTT
uniref:alanine--tRNA ligase n=1 Tax=Panagrolaimus davidi TaxID=227884 RepID=A0A914PK12_9BILA